MVDTLHQKLNEQKRLLKIFPYPGRDPRATDRLEARREALRKRIAELEEQLEAIRKEDRKRVEQKLVEERVQVLKVKELAKAPRCILAEKHVDEEGETLEINLVLAKYIGELELNSSLVTYRDYGGYGCWVPVYQYPTFNPKEVPEVVVQELTEAWGKDYASWKEYVDSLQKVEKVRSYTYFGDNDDLKHSEEVSTVWVTPDGKELSYVPFPPKSVEERIETWWWDNLASSRKPKIEAAWREQAIQLLNSIGWEVRC